MSPYLNPGPSIADVTTSTGLVVLEFGTDWCGHCSAAQPAITEVLSGRPEIQHIKVEDGPGRKLGRFFRVKLWPTLVFLSNGEEKARAVRPVSTAAVEEALQAVV